MSTKKPVKPCGSNPVPDLPVAIISDVHANAAALKSVLADIRSLEVNTIVCLGDTVGYGKDALECVRLVREACLLSVMGNHEAMLLFAETPLLKQMPEDIGKPLLDARRQLDDEAMNWIRNQPLIAEMGPVSFSHPSRFKPGEFNYVTTSGDADLHFKQCGTEVSFFGHTHAPCVWQEADGKSGTAVAYDATYQGIRLVERKRYAINVGSVGRPRDEDPRSCYVVFNPGTRLLLFRRVGI